MKRGRKSMAFNVDRNGTEAGGFGHIPIIYSGPSFSYLPRDIMYNVLLRLSVKRILVCKIVCKAWYDLVSDPEFAKLHLDQAQAYPLIQISRHRIQSRMLYLVQPEVEDFELKLERCDHSEYNSKCDCYVKFDLDTKFKLPLRNPQMIYDGNGRNMLDHVGNNRIRLKMKDHKYRVVNSCNGLLCLSSPSDNYPLALCNPVTGEFINLPKARAAIGSWIIIGYGFGFSPATNKYIVIRMFRRGYLDPNIDRGAAAEIHTLGTETWEAVDFSDQLSPNTWPTYLNGFVYWPYHSQTPTQTICATSFDVENECFGYVSAPPMGSIRCSEMKVAALGGELSLSCYFPSGAIGVWVLKDHGATKAWSKVFSIQSKCDERWPFHYCPCDPIKFLNDGALLMFHSYTNSFTYVHPKKQRFRYFKIIGTSADLEVTAHIPSFVSLKDALSGHNMKVLKSRCAELKLQNEGASFSVVEKDIHGLRKRLNTSL